MLYVPLLVLSCIPNRYPICHDRDHEGVVNFPPVKHVDSLDRVAEDIDAADGRVAVICHYLSVVSPVEFWVNVDPEVSDGFCGDVHVLRAMYRVGVLYSWYRLADQVRVGAAVGESHEFALFGIGG
jgi:hypothetical protein